MTPVQKRQLRARAHALKPVILIGNAGLSDAVLAETDRALHDHELIKIRLPGMQREFREQMTTRLCEQLGAEQVQAVGHVRVIFRPNPLQATEAATKGIRKTPNARTQRSRK